MGQTALSKAEQNALQVSYEVLGKKIDLDIDFVKKNGYFEYRRNEQSKYWMYETINEHLRDSFYHNPHIEEMLERKERQVLQGNLSSFVAAKDLLDTYFAEIMKR